MNEAVIPQEEKKVQEEVSVEVLKKALEEQSAFFIDVRDADEYRYEHIEGTEPIPFEQLKKGSSLPKEKPVVLICQAGIRSKEAAAFLRGSGFQEVSSLAGGLQAWKKAGYPVIRQGSLPIMRQVQIAAGILIWVGAFVPGFRWLVILVGAGLLYAGFSGRCGMAALLSRMPWNKSAS